MTDCPRHTEYKGLALASLSLVSLPLALAQLASVSLAPLTLTSLTLAFDYIYNILSNQTLLYLDYITTSIYDLVSIMNLISICDVFNH